MNRVLDLPLLNRILRTPAEVAADCRDDHDATAMARTSLVVIVVGALLFGAAVGSWQGGLQTLLGAGKLPVATLATLVLCAPAFYAVSAVFDRPWSVRSVVSLMLVAGARLALVLLAATPALWLAINLGAGYDLAKLVATVAFALGGLAALALLVRGIGDGAGKKQTVALFMAVFLLVGAQTSWMLRPYIGTPGEHGTVYFTRAREGGLVVQLGESVGRLLDPRREARRSVPAASAVSTEPSP
jgi:hypothetical protein